MTEPLNRNWTTPEGHHDGGISTGIGYTIAWQKGPLTDGGRNGAYPIEVLEAVKQRLEHFQRSKFECRENAIAIMHLEQALGVLCSRIERRRNEGTLGTTKP